MSPRNLDQNELNMSVKLPTDDESNAFEDRGKWTENFVDPFIRGMANSWLYATVDKKMKIKTWQAYF